METKPIESLSYNDRFDLVGIVTIREVDSRGNRIAYLEYNGKRMRRPPIANQHVPAKVFEGLGVHI